MKNVAKHCLCINFIPTGEKQVILSITIQANVLRVAAVQFRFSSCGKVPEGFKIIVWE
jgi:hypothetical protein